jgi:hypothetical protein
MLFAWQQRLSAEPVKLPVNPAPAELGSPFIRNFSSLEYGAHHQNWAIVQDSRGLMYFGNSDCILEYDGVHWRIIRSASGTIIRSLAIGEDGIIYAGGDGEFGCLLINKDGLRTYVNLSDGLPKEERNFNDVWSTHVIKDSVYFMTIQAIFHYRKGKIERIPISVSNFSNAVYGYLIIPMMTDEPLGFLENNELVRLPFPKKYYDLLKGNVSILPYPQKKLLITTARNGIFLYDFDYAIKNLSALKAMAIEEIPETLIEKFVTEADNYILKHEIYQSCQVHENSYALATRSGGIVLFDQEGKLIQIINKERGLKQNMCWDIYADKDKNLWAALNSGISYIELSSPITRFSEINGLEETANAMCRYEDTVYIAAMSGVNYLQKYQLKTDRDNNVFVRINQNFFETWGFAVQKGLLFAAAGQNGVLWIKDKKLIDIGFNRKELRNYVYCLGTSRKFPNHVFVGLRDSLGVFEIKDDAEFTAQSFHYSQTGNLKDIKTQVRYFADDKYGNLWVASAYQGVMCLKFTGSKPDQFETHYFYGCNGVPKEVWQRMWLEDDRILLGNSQGFMEAALPKNQDYRNIQFTANEALNSLLPKNANVGIIYLDEAKNIWFLGSGRFTMLKKENNSYRFIQNPFRKMQFSGADGFTVEPSGILWLCTDYGAYRYDPAIEKNYQQPFRTLIRKVIKGDDTVIFNGSFYQPQQKRGEFYPLLAEQQHTDLIPSLPYQENSLVFEYAAVYYEHASANQYKYFLQGYDKKWKEWNFETRVVYTNMSEGEYFFQVKGKNIFDYESEVTGYRFRILAPWYRTYIAFFGYAVILLLLFYLGIRFNSRRLQAAKEKLEIIVFERTAKVVRQRDEIAGQKDELEIKNVEITRQKNAIENYSKELTITNENLITTKNALWGEMELAKKIQTVLLPDKPSIPGYEIAAYMQPADEVGGDYYDVIEIKKEWIVDSEWWLDSERAEEKEGKPCRGGACLHPDSEKAKEKEGEPCRGGSCARPKDSGQPPKTNPEKPPNLFVWATTRVCPYRFTIH